MIRIFRSCLAVLSAFGLGASAYCYVRSYSGLAMDTLPTWALFLHVGTVFLVLPFIALEYPALKNRSFFGQKLAQDLPKWMIPSMQVLGVFFFIHFVVFLVEGHVAGPGVRNGQYVLESHGRIVKVITEAEYLKLKGAELRLFAAGWIFFYFVSTTYWTFRRNSRSKQDRELRHVTIKD